VADFQFLHNPVSRIWVIAAPRRAHRPNEAEKHLNTCPFCPGGKALAEEVFRIKSAAQGENAPDAEQDWQVLVVYNKFPFAPIHEVVIHSQDHLKSFVGLAPDHVGALFKAYQHRYNEHSHRGQVVIFHNHGAVAGESLPHPHTQIAVVPQKVCVDAPELRSVLPQGDEYVYELEQFFIITPKISQWPDEVWIAPKTKGKSFGQVTDSERSELAYIMRQLVLLFDHRYNRDFPFNFYIYPGESWYLRLIPRIKPLGGFELATGISVNTQRPEETMAFIKQHLHEPDLEKILSDYQAEYKRTV